MKASHFILAAFLLMTLTFFGQTNSISGVIKDVQPAFAEQYALTVGETTLILLREMKDTKSQNFKVNKSYKDLLILAGDKYVLNPKYANKAFKFTYTINGKGWKCIETIKRSKK